MNTEILSNTALGTNPTITSFLSIFSFTITFYVSYLFTHFVILNLYEITNTWIIFVSILVGHTVLNISTLLRSKRRTFGDLFIQRAYINIKSSSHLTKRIMFRSLLTSIIFYLSAYLIFLTGFKESYFVIGLISIIILNWKIISFIKTKVSILDILTQTALVKT